MDVRPTPSIPAHCVRPFMVQSQGYLHVPNPYLLIESTTPWVIHQSLIIEGSVSEIREAVKRIARAAGVPLADEQKEQS